MEHISKLIGQAVNQEPAPTGSQPSKSGSQIVFEKAIKKTKIVDCPTETIKSTLRMVMLKVGIRAANLPNDEEKAVLINHVITAYKGHTPEEVLLAFDMAITGKLDVDPNPYENFSCLYFSRIMTAYREWARQEYKLPRLNLEEDNKQLAYSIDPKKELLELIDLYKSDLKAGKLRPEFVLPSVYDSLVKHGLIVGVGQVDIEHKRQAVIAFINAS